MQKLIVAQQCSKEGNKDSTTMHYTLKFVILFMHLYGEFGWKNYNLVSACNSFNDFCDGIDEEPDDIKSATSLHDNQLPNTVGWSHHNYSRMEEMNNRSKRSPPSIHGNEEKTSSQVTTILDQLLFHSGYDRQIRPQINGPPVQVITKHK